jgi:hypothetical protein
MTKIILAILLIVSYLSFTYYYFDGWWYSSLGTILILTLSYLIWKKDFLKVIGLSLSIKSLIKVIGLAILMTIASIFIIKYIASNNGISFKYTDIRNYYHDIFYILNEELILGGIAIYILLKEFKISTYVVSIALALMFSIIHFIFYKYIFQTGLIKIDTLIVIFFFGLIRNNFIIISNHIGYSWALHFGWMVVMFGSHPYWIETKFELTEPENFNIILGSHEMIVLTSISAIISFILLKRKYYSQHVV